MEDGLLKSNTPRRKTENAKKNDKNKSIYIDLIAIVQDLDIKGVADNE